MPALPAELRSPGGCLTPISAACSLGLPRAAARAGQGSGQSRSAAAGRRQRSASSQGGAAAGWGPAPEGASGSPDTCPPVPPPYSHRPFLRAVRRGEACGAAGLASHPPGPGSAASGGGSSGGERHPPPAAATAPPRASRIRRPPIGGRARRAPPSGEWRSPGGGTPRQRRPRREGRQAGRLAGRGEGGRAGSAPRVRSLKQKPLCGAGEAPRPNGGAALRSVPARGTREAALGSSRQRHCWLQRRPSREHARKAQQDLEGYQNRGVSAWRGTQCLPCRQPP